MVTGKSQYDRSRAVWTNGALAFLTANYPSGMALKTLATRTRHHIYEVQRKAAQLGLSRFKTPPAPTANPEPPRYMSSARFTAATFDEVIGWLREHGHRVEPGIKPGLWKVGCFDAQTPQMVVRLANDRRQRDHKLPPFQVDTGGGTPAVAAVLDRSLTGSSMTMQLAWVGK